MVKINNFALNKLLLGIIFCFAFLIIPDNSFGNEDKPIPSIAEVIDLTITFKMASYGIQLSEETAIGQYPMECLDGIDRIICEIDSEIK